MSNIYEDYLMHFNEKHDNLGRFAKKNGGSSALSGPFSEASRKSSTNAGSLGNGPRIVGSADYRKLGLRNDSEQSNSIDRNAYAAGKRAAKLISGAQNQNKSAYIMDPAKRIVDQMLDGKTYTNVSRLISMGNAAPYEGENSRLWYSKDDYKAAAQCAADAALYNIKRAMQEEGIQDAQKLIERVRPGIEGYANQQFMQKYEESERKRKAELSREKTVEGSASVRRRATNEKQAYELMSQQRARDVKMKVNAKSASEAYAQASAQRAKDLEKKLRHDEDADEYLMHFNPNHDPETGQFTASKTGRRITRGAGRIMGTVAGAATASAWANSHPEMFNKLGKIAADITSNRRNQEAAATFMREAVDQANKTGANVDPRAIDAMQQIMNGNSAVSSALSSAAAQTAVAIGKSVLVSTAATLGGIAVGAVASGLIVAGETAINRIMANRRIKDMQIEGLEK